LNEDSGLPARRPLIVPEHPDLVGSEDLALLTDLYELTMLQAYWQQDMHETAVFSLFVRDLPPSRNFLLACGIDDAVDGLAALRFLPAHIDYLRSLDRFQDPFLEWLQTFRFTGAVRAVEEGTPVFGEEPILEVIAPISQAQLVETLAMNQVHLQTLIASKAARIVAAAQGRRVVDFGLRRAHGVDAGLKLARASFIAGAEATSNLLAGQRYGIPVSGTMAHSFVQSFDHERDAFRAFMQLYPDTTLLVDTYDTLESVDLIVQLASELGADFRVRALRLDSGNLVALARGARQKLDAAGLANLQLFASGGLDEFEIRDLLAQGAPLDGFGVGTRMAVSQDAPSLDIAYKLTAYAGQGRIKLSQQKESLPGAKQVFRVQHDGHALHDVVARFDEVLAGQPLLRAIMANGERKSARRPLPEIQEHARAQIEKLPPAIRGLDPARTPYEVKLSPGLEAAREQAKRRFAWQGENDQE
jgi:nicotinate phosphoribosyltransferase